MRLWWIGGKMAISYNKLEITNWQEISAAKHRKKADIASNTLMRMEKDQEITMQVLERICEALDSDFGEIMEYIPDEDKKRDN
mgnify:CR=1 FL=1